MPLTADRNEDGATCDDRRDLPTNLLRRRRSPTQALLYYTRGRIIQWTSSTAVSVRKSRRRERPDRAQVNAQSGAADRTFAPIAMRRNGRSRSPKCAPRPSQIPAAANNARSSSPRLRLRWSRRGGDLSLRHKCTRGGRGNRSQVDGPTTAHGSEQPSRLLN